MGRTIGFSKMVVAVLVGFVLACCLIAVSPVCEPVSFAVGNQGVAQAFAKTKIKLSKKSVTVYVGKTTSLKLKGAKASKVKWSSSKSSVATVRKGEVVGRKAGSAIVTAKYRGKRYRCKVIVRKKNSSASLRMNTSTLTFGSTAAGTEMLLVRYTGRQSIYWNTSNDNVVECWWGDSWYGDETYLYVKPVGQGETTLTITSDEGKRVSKKIVVDACAHTNWSTERYVAGYIYKCSYGHTTKVTGDYLYATVKCMTCANQGRYNSKTVYATKSSTIYGSRVVCNSCGATLS